MPDISESPNPEFQRRVEHIVMLERLIRQLPTDTLAAISREIARYYPHLVLDDPPYPGLSE